jgi:predicted small lipoprotein YifL
MKNPIQLTTILAALALLAACGDKAPEPTRDPATAAAAGDADRAGHAHGLEAGGRLQLDGGKKWKSTAPTHLGMANMRRLLADFAALATRDYRALGAALRAEANLLIKQCTLEGKPHDQLHLVLNPMLAAIDKLATGSGGAAEYEAMQAHLKEYATHFEL